MANDKLVKNQKKGISPFQGIAKVKTKLQFKKKGF
jgi:hypothetical protein